MKSLIFIGMISLMTNQIAKAESVAIFAMGCFWCGEEAFKDKSTHSLLPGVFSIKVGYTGGQMENPTYESHHGHKEAVKIVFDPDVISYNKLLKIFWRNVDPLNGKGQFCDQGPQYSSVIYYSDDEQKLMAEKSKNPIESELEKQVATEIISATDFWDAEDYHQDYAEKNPVRYKYYRWGCGRDARLNELWGRGE